MADACRCYYRTYHHTPSDLARRMWFYVHAVGWFRCSPAYDVYRKSFFGYLLMYVRSGRGVVVQDSKSFPVDPGCIVFLDLTREHRYYAAANDPWEILWVHFGGQQCGEYLRLLEADLCPVLPGTPHSEVLFMRLFDLFRCRPAGAEARAGSLITRILTDLVGQRLEAGALPDVPYEAGYPESIRASIAYMERNFARPLKLEELAQQASLSPFHFARLFKRVTGMSVMEYLLHYRIQQAKHLLRETRLSVREIADMVGFSDQSYFSKLFKRYEHMTPTAYRMTVHAPHPSPGRR
ncbi:AraC family transcriptional regulator [Alicyclobacillus cellulosilyticus]|uniref:AraC family transcriptional regulator n=1 Tax=Alicyclobacillus cellulosilyticus TaxID=1003997 RepID=A0A917K2V8_9BACL|nr:AraC family transcriptional regulator [Alicyclobacillus cellulosilyticus]GGI97949.1 AraC family transcriptional regulator [Alicyclobacillus cellulosilyticus]